jgi:hypothetical protein
LVEIVTKFTPENAFAYSKWAGRRAFIKMMVIMGIIVFAVGFIFNGWGSVLIFAVWFLMFLILWLPTLFICRKIAQNKVRKSKLFSEKTENTFTFNADNFICKTVREGGNGELTVKYAEIIKVIETKKYFFIKADILQVFVLPKEDIPFGQEDELRELLKPSAR